MISDKEIFKIGTFLKPHGIKGELSFSFDNDIFDRAKSPYIICVIEGIYVPFFIKEYRFKSNNAALIILDGIDSEEKAQRFAGLDIYYPRAYYKGSEKEEEEEYTLHFFVGFTIIDQNAGELGVITDIDEDTINTLFIVEQNNGDELLIPATDDFISEIDVGNKIIRMKLVDGLIDI